MDMIEVPLTELQALQVLLSEMGKEDFGDGDYYEEKCREWAAKLGKVTR